MSMQSPNRWVLTRGRWPSALVIVSSAPLPIPELKSLFLQFTALTALSSDAP